MSYYSLCGELRLLIHRVELKLSSKFFNLSFVSGLLIYRVELKLDPSQALKVGLAGVANLPCGVETLYQSLYLTPCRWLLIYRVELKRLRAGSMVPLHRRLLIHRVELKPNKP